MITIRTMITIIIITVISLIIIKTMIIITTMLQPLINVMNAIITMMIHCHNYNALLHSLPWLHLFQRFVCTSLQRSSRYQGTNSPQKLTQTITIISVTLFFFSSFSCLSLMNGNKIAVCCIGFLNLYDKKRVQGFIMYSALFE